MNTVCGGMASLVIIYIVFMFASLKLMHLKSYHQPTINTYTLPSVFTKDDVYETTKQNFRVAVALEGYLTNEFKNDPRFVKWFAMAQIFEDGKSTKREVPMNPCTEEDYEKFFPVDERS